MLVELGTLAEVLPTVVTLVDGCPGVHLKVPAETGGLAKALATVGALVGSLTRVQLLIFRPAWVLTKGLAVVQRAVGFFSHVGLVVVEHLGLSAEAFPAIGALKGALCQVDEARFGSGFLSTQRACVCPALQAPLEGFSDLISNFFLLLFFCLFVWSVMIPQGLPLITPLESSWFCSS